MLETLASLFRPLRTDVAEPTLELAIEIARTSPLKGLWSHARGGGYHDGRFPSLDVVVNHYDSTFDLHLTDQERHDLVEHLKSL